MIRNYSIWFYTFNTSTSVSSSLFFSSIISVNWSNLFPFLNLVYLHLIKSASILFCLNFLNNSPNFWGVIVPSRFLPNILKYPFYLLLILLKRMWKWKNIRSQEVQKKNKNETTFHFFFLTSGHPDTFPLLVPSLILLLFTLSLFLSISIYENKKYNI